MRSSASGARTDNRAQPLHRVSPVLQKYPAIAAPEELTKAASSIRAHYDNKRSSHFSTKGETLPPTKSANANNALRASPTG